MKKFQSYFSQLILITLVKLTIQVINKILIIEFIAATMSQSHYLKTDKLYSAFKMLDTDGSGKIDKNELRNILGKDKALLGKDDEYWE